PGAETIRGVRRLLGVAPKARKTGILTADVKAAVDAIDLDTVAGVRDRVLLLLGFAGGMRRELVALDVDDLEAAPEGYVARLRRSKTDQEAAGRQVSIVYGTDPGCCPSGPSGPG
ncbi:MAG: integrase, partial [Actinomycetota bacterium]|nr:integrase [Actinomycetota bacterium]